MILDYLTDLVIGFIFTIFFISVGFILALNFKTLYYNDVDLLNIEATASLDKEVIKKNYDEIIEYIQPTNKDELHLSNFTLSETATKHFAEIKNTYGIIYLLAIFSGIAALVIVILKIRNRDYQFLLLSSIIASAIPFILLGSFVTKFTTSFSKLCSSVFNKNTWKLSSKLDPIVNIFPERYFQHSAIAVFSFAVICGLCLLVIWKGLKQKNA